MNTQCKVMVVGLLAFLLFAPMACAAESSPTMFRNVNVVDVSTGTIKPNMMVLVSGNQIAAVGSSVQIPADATIVDASGKFLIPGLWDMHSHALGYWELSSRLNIANGVTGIRDPGTSRPAVEIVKLRADIEAGSAFGPRVVAGGKIIDGASSRKKPTSW